MNRDIISGDVLRNELISGYYAINVAQSGVVENLPSGAEKYGVLINFKELFGDYGFALYSDNINLALYINHKTESGWKGWKKVSLSNS